MSHQVHLSITVFANRLVLFIRTERFVRLGVRALRALKYLTIRISKLYCYISYFLIMKFNSLILYTYQYL